MCIFYIYVSIWTQHLLKLQKEFLEEDFYKRQQKITDSRVFWLCSKTSICYNTQALLLSVVCLFQQQIILTGRTADILINLTLFYVELKATVDKSSWLWDFWSFFWLFWCINCCALCSYKISLLFEIAEAALEKMWRALLKRI